MAKISLDFRDWKHVRSDKHSTTLKHKRGHQMTLAHSALSPDARVQLQALSKVSEQAMTQPQAAEQGYANAQMHAEGGEVSRKEENRPAKEVDEVPDKSMPQVDADDQDQQGTAPLVRWEFARGGNAGEARKELFGSSSAPSNKAMRAKHIAHIKEFAKRAFGIDMHPSGGKIDKETGQRRDADAEIGVDKPDWRSGNLESQWNPDAMVHELAHLMLLPKGIGLKDAQALMDKQYSDVQKQHGYMKQKRSHHEIQPMAVENLIRRHLGLPANTNSVPVKPGEGPRTAVEDNAVVGNRVQKGNGKQVDLIRQSAFLTPENRQRVEHVMSGNLKFHPEAGWQENPDAMGAKVRMAKEEAQGMPSSVMAEGGQVKTLDYNQIRREKRDMNNKENNQPVKPKRFDEGGKVPAPNGGDTNGQPQQNMRDAANVEKQGSAQSQASTLLNPGQMWDNVKNAYAEGTDDVQSSDTQDIPQAVRAPKDQPDIGGVQDVTGQKPAAIPDSPETTPEYKALLRYYQTQPQHDSNRKNVLGGGPTAEDEAYRDYERNKDVQSNPGAHSVFERGQAAKQQQQLYPPQSPMVYQPAQEVAQESVNPNDFAPAVEDNDGQTNQVMARKINSAPDDFGNPADDANPPGSPASAPEAQQPAQAQAPAPSVQPPTNPLNTTPKSQSQHYQDDMNQLLGGDQDFIADKAIGHIQPKTMADLFADKNFAGKIGMIGGIILSGIGSGLAGQPNAALAQLNNQINNDLAAQQHSSSNAQNLLRINQQGLQNQANIEDTSVGIQAKAQALTWSQMAYHAFDQMKDQVAAMPEGPQKQAAEQNLAMTAQAMGQERMSVFAKAAAMSAQAKAFYGAPTQAAQGSADPVAKERAYQQRLNMLRMTNPDLAKQMSDYHIPYMDGTTSVPVSEPVKQQLTAMNTLDMKGREIMDYANKYNLAKQAHASPAELAQVWKVGAQKAAEMVTMYNNSIQGGVLTQGRLAWLDSQIKNPANAFQNALGEMAKVQEVIDSNSSRRDQLLYGPEVGFVPARGAQPPRQAPPSDNAGVPSGMVKVMRPDGVSGNIPIQNLSKLPKGWKQIGR